MNKAILNKVVQLSVQLKEARDEVAKHQERARRLEEEIAALMGSEPAAEQGQGAREQQTEGHGRSSVAAAVVQALDAEPENIMSVEDVKVRIGNLGHHPAIESLRTTLARLARDERILNVGRGRYQSVMRTEAGKSLNGGLPHGEGGMIQ